MYTIKNKTTGEYVERLIPENNTFVLTNERMYAMAFSIPPVNTLKKYDQNNNFKIVKL
jgi:hypothetical protein